MSAVLKLHPGTRKPEKRLVDQVSGLQRMALALLPHIVPSRPAKLFVKGDRKLFPGTAIAALPFTQQASDVGSPGLFHSSELWHTDVRVFAVLPRHVRSGDGKMNCGGW